MQYIYSLLSDENTSVIEKPTKVYSLKNMLHSEEFENLSITYYGQSRYLLKLIFPEYRTNLKSIIGLIDTELKK
jgi:hypothetical protein